MSYEVEFLTNRNEIEMEVNAGKVLIRMDDDTVYKGNYVSGDMEDKLGQTVRAYKALVSYLLATIGEKDIELEELRS